MATDLADSPKEAETWAQIKVRKCFRNVSNDFLTKPYTDILVNELHTESALSLVVK